MASLTRGPLPLLRPNRAQSGLDHPTTQGQVGVGVGSDQQQYHQQHQHQHPHQHQHQRPTARDTEILPYHATKTRGVGDTPLNTPAQPMIAIVPRLAGGGGGGDGSGTGGPTLGNAWGDGGGGGGSGGGMGRPIGRAGLGYAPHAATPGNTPSSLETMGRRIAGKLQGHKAGGTPVGGGGDARIAPSYERRFTAGLTDLSHRLATHQEKPVPVDSPSSSMQRLQLVSPASTDQGQKADWPDSYDTDTNDGESVQVKEGQDNRKVE